MVDKSDDMIKVIRNDGTVIIIWLEYVEERNVVEVYSIVNGIQALEATMDTSRLRITLHEGGNFAVQR